MSLRRRMPGGKEIYQEIYEQLVQEKFDEMQELTDEINQNDLTYYFQGNTFRKRSKDFDDSDLEELSKKIRSGEMKLKQVKEQQNIFKLDLDGVSSGRFKSEEQKIALENIKLHYKPR